MTNDLILFAQELDGLDMKPREVGLVIDGLRYNSRKMSASTQLDLMPRLAVLLGPQFLVAVATGQFRSFSLTNAMTFAERALHAGLVPMAKAALDRVSCSELYSTKAPGKVVPDFDEHFGGEMNHLLKVVIFALAHNYQGPTRGAH